MWCVDRSIPNTQEEKTSAYKGWLRYECKRHLSAVERRLTQRAFEVLEHAVRELDGYFSPSEYDLFGFSNAPALSKYIRDLAELGLVAGVQDEDDKRRKTIRVLAKGYMVNYARGQSW